MNDYVADALATLYVNLFGGNCAGTYDMTDSKYKFKIDNEFGMFSVTLTETEVLKLSIYRLVVIMRNQYNDKYWEKRY